MPLTDLLSLFLLISIAIAIWYLARYLKVFSYREIEEASAQNLLVPGVLGEESFHNFEGESLYYIYRRNLKAQKTIVLLHGIGASSYCYRLLSPLLEKDYSVLMVDLLGFGKSSKNAKLDLNVKLHCSAIHSLVQKLELNNVAVLGSSMGGAISLYLASFHPNTYSEVIGISPALALKRLSFFHLPTLAGLAKGIGRQLVTRDFIRKQLLNVYSDRSLITEDVIENYFEPYRNNVDAMLCLLHSTSVMKNSRSWEELKDLEARVLILWGEKDKVTPIRHKSRFQKHFPGWKIKVHPKAGHHVQEDSPEWVASVVDAFLKK